MFILKWILGFCLFLCKYNSVAMPTSKDISPHFFCKVCVKYSNIYCCDLPNAKTRPAFSFIKRSKKSGFKTQFIGTRSGSGGAEPLPPNHVRSVFLGPCKCLAVAVGRLLKRKPLRLLDEVHLCSLVRSGQAGCQQVSGSGRGRRTRERKV